MGKQIVLFGVALSLLFALASGTFVFVEVVGRTPSVGEHPTHCMQCSAQNLHSCLLRTNFAQVPRSSKPSRPYYLCNSRVMCRTDMCRLNNHLRPEAEQIWMLSCRLQRRGQDSQ
eukprot:3912703-Rhodomonas_salina.4